MASYASGINDSGEVVGASQTTGTGSTAEHATLWSGGTATDLGTLGGTSSGATGINSSGQVVGDSQTISGYVHATLWSGGTASDLGTLGGLTSYARGINDSGEVVGRSETGVTYSSTIVATLWTGGGVFNLNYLLDSSGLGWVLSQAFAINDLGQIVGSGYINGQIHGFLLTPDVSSTPLPPTLPLFVSGLAALGMLGWRRKRKAAAIR